MSKQTKHILTSEDRDQFISNLSRFDFVQKPKTFVISDYKELRNQEQNDKMWAMLRDISRQVEWAGKLRDEYAWKDLLTAALKVVQNESLEIVPGLEGGVVVLGLHTSKMSMKDMSDLIEYMYVFGANNNVEWTEEK